MFSYCVKNGVVILYVFNCNFYFVMYVKCFQVPIWAMSFSGYLYYSHDFLIISTAVPRVDNMFDKPMFTLLLRSRFVFQRSLVQISAWRPAILTEVSRGFSQSLDANVGMS
jgi:hypothetical protein